MEEIGFLAFAKDIELPIRMISLENGDYEPYWKEGNELKVCYGTHIRMRCIIPTIAKF